MIKHILIFILVTISSLGLTQDCIEELASLYNYREFLAMKIDQGMDTIEDRLQLDTVIKTINYKRAAHANYRRCSLESLYPKRIQGLKKASNAFKVGNDIPSNKIQSIHYRIRETFHEIQASMRDFSNNYEASIDGVDVSSLILLMSEPIEIWEEMSLCYGNNLDGIREAYRKGRDFCPRDRRKSKEIEERLVSFHANLSNFLLTTASVEELRKVLIQKLFSCKERENEDCFQAFKNRYFSLRELFHPLLGQALLGIISHQGSFRRVDNSNRMILENRMRNRLLNNVSSMFGSFGPNNCYALALWPAAARPMLQSTMSMEIALVTRMFSENCGSISSYHTVYRNFDGMWGMSVMSRSAQKKFITLPRDVFEEY